jgi:hypothetical protein
MHFGDQITVMPGGLRIAEKELEPIGLYDGSTAFAMWFQDVRAREPKNSHRTRPDHLIVAPFEINTWPYLVRVELKLDDRIGALTEATAVLKRVGFNVLSIDGTPTGHHHATINLIGEVLPIRHLEELNLTTRGESFRTEQRRFQCDALWDYCCNELAPAMIGYQTRLVTSLQRADARQLKLKGYGFLRRTFADGDLSQRGRLFDAHKLPQNLTEAGIALTPRAVECNWLKSLAYFWVYRDRAKATFRFSFQRSNRTLAIYESDLNAYTSGLKGFSPPLKAIATINSFEQYLRVAVSKADERNHTVAISIPYEAFFDSKWKTSRGFWHHVFAHLSGSGINVRKVSVATRIKTENQESSDLELLASKADSSRFQDPELAALQDSLNVAVEAFRPGKLRIRDSTRIRRLVVRRLFVSTNLDWIQNRTTKKFYPRYLEIKEAVNWHGFTLVDALNQAEAEGVGLKSTASIADRSIELLRTCEAFLQIIPLEAAEKLQWLSFESGGARALRKPTAICVECNSSSRRFEERTIASWEMTLKIPRGEVLEPFEKGRISLRDAVGKALERLGNELPSSLG